MDGGPNISEILAALAGQPNAGGTPSQSATPQQQQPAAAAYGAPAAGAPAPAGYPGALTTPTPPAGAGFALPQPTSTGHVDLRNIRAVNSGSVSYSDALAKARGFAAERGVSTYDGRSGAGSPRDDPRGSSGRASYRRSRSRSRSPPRRDHYNPYRDDRRGGGGYRDRSRSPSRRGNFSPAPGGGRGRDGFRSPIGNNGREEDNQETILVDSALVGLVIGRQGENLRRVEQDTGTRIQFITGPDSGSAQRQCRITGNARSRLDAKREIYRIIDENGGNPPRETGPGGRDMPGSVKPNQPLLREGENSIQIMVPDRTVGLIIGRAGETIKDLQERSGCHVNIVGQNKSVNGLRPVNLIGSPAAAAKAKELILEIVDSDTRNMGPPPRESRGGGGGGGGSGYENHGGSDGKLNDHVTVPSEAVGMIIGKGGETIKEMQNSTGCKINVAQASGADIDREIGLVGSKAAIEAARQAILEKVETVVSRDSKNGGFGGRRGGRDNNSASDPYSQQQQAAYGLYQQPGQNQYAAQQAAPGTGTAGAGDAADPSMDPNNDPRYAPWGGYQNYVAMWYAAMARQGQQAGGEQPKPPGA
ncbi:hypothetical protein BDY21DRAFT_161891 [Lineolata rhizophorae]|uniref:K Homology domain-containing protein n=1 Tax=Lineolata rhizophorae TaxID=578093 RepID=A0A6A6P8X2_9PEZI|nr:hypothetical protein BDY21DRAFT_161891 [Lineolata rhizophorae]